MNSGLTNKNVCCLSAVGANLFAGTTSGGVFLSTNDGTDWTSLSTGLPTSDVRAFSVVGNDLFVGTYGSGVWRRSLLELLSTIGVSSPEVPHKFGLDQNYPNPFNPSTTIKYTLSQQSFVTLRIFDMLGREVAILANEKKEAGKFSVRWDATGIPSGIYLYRFDAGAFSNTKKLVVLK
jgi:hypothetical protein